MGDPAGFKKYKREMPTKYPVSERIQNYKEFVDEFPEDKITTQATRCMDCGIPFCHGIGCPLGNLIPSFNEKIHMGHWEEALDILHSTNNFPEFTGRVCPAPCEKSCTLSINNDPVTIEQIELMIVERGFKEGWIKPVFPKIKTRKKIAIIGSGPAGLAAAQQLCRVGHKVAVFEKDDRIGGILRYGIPDFKLEKWIIDRRIDQMKAEGVVFETGVNVGEDISAKYMKKSFDVICITMGARKPRELNIEGRELSGVHFAMDFLTQMNRINAGDMIPPEDIISAKDKIVAVIGGGDTGSDCVGTSIRQGAKKVYQFEIMPKPQECRTMVNPNWPYWPNILRTSSSHEEGCERQWSILTKRFCGDGSKVQKLQGIKVDWSSSDQKGNPILKEVTGTEFEMDVDLVLLAMGFVHVEHDNLIKGLGLQTDNRGNIIVDNSYATSVPGVFAAGDSALGASLVVKAIAQGREMARSIDIYLMGQTELPSTAITF